MFDSPTPNITVDQGRDRCWRDEANGEPDPHTCDGAEDQGHQQKKATVTSYKGQLLVVPVATGMYFRDHQPQTTSNGKVRDEDVQDGHDGDQHTATGRQLPNWVVHNGSS